MIVNILAVIGALTILCIIGCGIALYIMLVERRLTEQKFMKMIEKSFIWVNNYSNRIEFYLKIKG